MHARFEAYRNTKLGRAIEAVAQKPERMIEYALLSRLKMPAVIALSWDVAPLLNKLSEGDRRDAKQYCGAIIGDIMRANGYEIINPRGSGQAGGVFTLGAVWAPLKHVEAMKFARRGFEEYSESFKALAK
ncbi:MAG: hypothetical protein ACREB2_11245 [Pseudolabrys sp.]